ncbi:hypothetical protein GF325_08520 [Candidatus Bathyarchaeota archaeon]|nr:hypothetical protein [Candidatus Bathyarchaeota archaeon]
MNPVPCHEPDTLKAQDAIPFHVPHLETRRFTADGDRVNHGFREIRNDWPIRASPTNCLLRDSHACIEALRNL